MNRKHLTALDETLTPEERWPLILAAGRGPPPVETVAELARAWHTMLAQGTGRQVPA
jgi:hypothetical protein